MGHFARCSALLDSLLEVSLDTRLILHGDGTGKRLFDNLPIDLYNWIKLDCLEQILLEMKPKISIVDSYLTNKEHYSLISKHSNQMICIDDIDRINYPIGSVILNPGIHGSLIPYLNQDSTLVGVDYILLRKPFRKKFLAPTINKQLESILFSTGGVDAKNLTLQLLHLIRAELPFVNICIIAAPGFRNLDTIQKQLDIRMKLLIAPDADVMCLEMQKADMGVTAGGQTVYEMACVGLPTIIMQTIENQSGNIAGLQAAGIGKHVGDVDRPAFLSDFSTALQECQDKNYRIQQSKLAMQTIDGFGASRVAQYCKEFVN